MVRTMQAYRELGSIRDLTPAEAAQYLEFLRFAYKDDLSTSSELLIKHPRWSIISGYYAMHNISKIYLAKEFNLKFSKPHIHSAVIQALRELGNKEEILELILSAKKEYKSIINLHLTLLQAKDEREKTQYYISEQKNPKVNPQRAAYFLENLCKPYIIIMEKLIENDNKHT